MKYKESIYNIYEQLGVRIVLFNTKTGGVVVPEVEHTKLFLDILKYPNKFDDKNKMKKEMKKYKFIIKEDHDELLDIKKLHEKGIKTSKSALGFIIVPTEYCNFACPYCFVYNYDRKPMSQEIYNRMYNAIKLKIKGNQELTLKLKDKYRKKGKDKKFIEKVKVPTRIDFTWFGGEPTLENKNIIKFMDKVNKLEKKDEVSINAGMITNGYILDYKLLKQFVDRKITFFQITLDGDKETHDKTRYLRESQGPTFDRIYNNLLDIQKNATKDLNFKISIRCNFLKTNQDSMERLKKKFAKDFTDHRFSIYFHQVYKSENDTSELNDAMYGENDGIDAACQLNNFNDLEKLNSASIDRMFEILPRPKSHPCFATNNSYCITVEGALFGCESMIGKDDKALGHINKDGTMTFYKKEYKRWKDSFFKDKETYKNCFDCQLLPVCIGGCKYNKFNSIMEGCVTTVDVVRKKLQDYLKVYVGREKDGLAELEEERTKKKKCKGKCDCC